MTSAATRLAPRAPSILNFLLEGRVFYEFGAYAWSRGLLKHLPKGDGHPVLVFPGFLAGDFSTRPIRRVLRNLGYCTYGWGLGRNLTFSPEREAQMIKVLEDTYAKHSRKVTIIGWSLGGVFAREIAKLRPELVRQVISLGSPINGPRHAARALPIFEAINGDPSPDTQKRMDRLHEAPPMPATSIYSKTDGVVHWKGSLQEESPQAQNIQVPASHLGLGVNPLVMYILADRLAQSEDNWRPFDTSGVRRLVYKSTKSKAL